MGKKTQKNDGKSFFILEKRDNSLYNLLKEQEMLLWKAPNDSGALVKLQGRPNERLDEHTPTVPGNGDTGDRIFGAL